jgi:hypothetical protein
MEVRSGKKAEICKQTREKTLTANNDYESSKWIWQSPTKQVLLIQIITSETISNFYEKDSEPSNTANSLSHICQLLF